MEVILRPVCLTTCLFFLTLLPVYLFSENTMTNSNDRYDFGDDEIYWQRYLSESETLSREFRSLFELLRNKEQSGIKVDWIKDYYDPFYEKSKNAALRITQTENLRSTFESLMLHGPYLLYDQHERRLFSEERMQYLYETLNFAYRVDQDRRLDILGIISLLIVTDRHKEIVQGTFYGDVEKQKKLVRNRIENSSDGKWVGMLSVDDYLKLLQFEYPILVGTPLSPPLGHVVDKVPNPFLQYPTTYDDSWPIMAMWTYQDDRVRDLLFELVAQSDKRVDSLADWAVYYLSLLQNSGELLPKTKKLLKEEIAKIQKNSPDVAKYLLDENGKVINPLQHYPGGVHPKINGIYWHEWITFAHNVPRLFRLAQLTRRLEFNEKIPIEERERLNIFRRELAISWSLSNKTNRGGPHISATLKKGDEHFEIYFREYAVPGEFGILRSCSCVFHWEDDGDLCPFSFGNPLWQNRKAFYERELAHPRPIYTADQIEYIKAKVMEFEKK